MSLRVLILLGTRPEAIKLAPVVDECRRRAGEIETLVCFTGQHREMLAQVDAYFGLRPDRNLDVMVAGQGLAELTGRCLVGVDGLLRDLEPGAVVAQGDTTTVMAASMAAFYRGVPFVHVEAGLRTGTLAAPWPEEFNRRVATLSADLHCAPTERAAEQLRREGIAPGRVRVTGNTVVDALLGTLARERAADRPWPERYAMIGDRRMVLVTGHRRESFGDGFRRICQAIRELGERFAGDVEIVYPVHPNPAVEAPVRELLAGRGNVHLVPPASYPEFVWLMGRSTLILTDSGGVQEEAPSLGKPVLILRDSTERPEAVECGAAELVGTSVATIVDRASRLLTDPAAYARMQVKTNPFGDGRASSRIVDFILSSLGR